MFNSQSTCEQANNDTKFNWNHSVGVHTWNHFDWDQLLGPFCPDPFGRKPIHHTALHSSLPQEFCDMAEEAALCLAKQGAKPLKLLYGQNALTIVPCKLYFQVEHK